MGTNPIVVWVRIASEVVRRGQWIPAVPPRREVKRVALDEGPTNPFPLAMGDEDDLGEIIPGPGVTAS